MFDDVARTKRITVRMARRAIFRMGSSKWDFEAPPKTFSSANAPDLVRRAFRNALLSIQAQVINLLMEIKAKLNLIIGFISHGLAVVGNLRDHVVVMYLGRIVEVADTRALLRAPRLRALFLAVP